MKYLFEHKSVGIVLESLRQVETAEEACDKGNSSGVIVVGWSSRGALLLRPEFACLSLPDITYLRLPLAYADLELFLSQQIQRFTEARTFGGLSSPLEQWVWALGQLLDDLREGDRVRAYARIAELRRFATAKWPDWYEGALRAIKQSIEKGDGAEDLIEICRIQSPAIDSLNAAAPLLRWSVAASSLQAFELVREVASYALQGALDLHSCRGAVSEDPAWRALALGCEEAQAAMTSLREAGSPADVRIKGCVDEICEGVKEILESSSADADLEECIKGWSADVDRVSSGLHSLSNLRDSIRASLSS